MSPIITCITDDNVYNLTVSHISHDYYVVVNYKFMHSNCLEFSVSDKLVYYVFNHRTTKYLKTNRNGELRRLNLYIYIFIYWK